MSKPKLLWIGDAVIDSGFSRVTHNVLDRLHESWDVSVMGLMYTGDPHPYPYKIYPCGHQTDGVGHWRFADIMKKVSPDIVLLLHDPWVVEGYMRHNIDVPFVAYVPVDAPNMRARFAAGMSKLSRAIFYTEFGREQAVKAGFCGRSAIIPHGVDTDIFRPMPRGVAREELGMDPSWFIVGMVARNQFRKRLDLALYYFAEWVRRYDLPPSVRLYLHCDPDDEGWDIRQLAEFFGVRDRLIITDGMTAYAGVPQEALRKIYCAMDVHLCTSLGEGWNLPVHESMACGIPQLVPEFAALGEWPRGAVCYAPVTSIFVTPSRINTIGGVVDREGMIAGLNQYYEDNQLREKYGKLALERATEARFDWGNIAQAFDRILHEDADL